MSKRERLKVYHGLPSSLKDKYTLFHIEQPISKQYISMPTGYGSLLYRAGQTATIADLDAFTVDFWICNTKIKSVSGAWYSIFELYDNGTGEGVPKISIVHDERFLFIRYPDFNWNNSFMLPLNESMHFRFIITNLGINIYKNGSLFWSVSTNSFDLKAMNLVRVLVGEHTTSADVYISDLHVSKIDRGDIFLTLPQDFINNKAIVKSRMGQQQIKGDPLYGQTTIDVVRIGSTKINETHVTCSRTDGNWTTGDTIKIKGINGELIGGVLDNDTALCRIVRSVNTNSFEVDNASTLAVGDTFKVMNTKSGVFDDYIRTITNVTGNVIVFTGANVNEGNIFNDGWDVLVESTTDSSSPIVKTSDNETVSGSWTGLATNEAKFTLGSNVNLNNKDLYVTYSLNIKQGNSDFTELPYSIEKVYDETGDELKEVSELVIYDDFKNKIKGNVKECPHIIKYALNKTVGPISGFSEVITQKNYDNIIKDDGMLTQSTSNVSQGVSQHLFSFNLIEMIERKIGPIKGNKIQWIKDNLTKIVFNYKGYGTFGTQYKLYVANYNNTDNAWENTVSHASSVATNIQCVLESKNTINDGRIDDNGFVHFLAYTDASDGISEARIYTDFCSINIWLNTDSDFSVYFKENNRARENPCNPILIQKETKTTKRLFPSKECFVTESLLCSGNNRPGGDKKNTVLCYPTFYYATTMGTGTYNKGFDIYRECLAKLGFDTQSHKFNNSLIQNSADNKTSSIKMVRGVSQSFSTDAHWSIPYNIETQENCMYLVPSLVSINNEMHIKLVYREISGSGSTGNKGVKMYKLPNKPLIK